MIRQENIAYRLTNPNASKEAAALMDYFFSIYGKKVISAQHTKTIQQRELVDHGDFMKEHIVNAWCSENKMILGQVKTDDKSNEITAVPKLLDMLFIKGCIVTVDALNTQKDIVKKIVKENKADYVVALKESHPVLHDEVKEYFSNEEKNDFKNESSVKTVGEYAEAVRKHWGG